ncbi:hypothetical protein BU15DRAFT_63381 [Melanogaster broomeanus]|nr:hypothetical protein BU15DRAFT_63381 [Melanogaster broomeanus]
MAQEFPNANVIGVDLSPVENETPAQNCKFFRVDLTSPPLPFEDNSFDVVQMRTVPSYVLTQAFPGSTPGSPLHADGFILFLEPCRVVSVPHCAGSDDWALGRKIYEMILNSKNEDGKSLFYAVEERTIRIPVGTWPEDAQQAQLGALGAENQIGLLEGFGPMFVKHDLISEDGFKALVNRVVAETKDDSLHLEQPWSPQSFCLHSTEAIIFTEFQRLWVLQKISDFYGIQMLFDAPEEVICHILSFLSPREIVRLRRTSKQFRDITYDPAIWRTAYANAPLLRPAGPFPYQSTQFLENTLIHSERVAQTWTSQPIIKAISRVLGPKVSCDSLWKVLGGRWFIWLETTKILCQDLDGATGSRHILWDSDAQIVRFDACLITSVDGQRVYILLLGTQLAQGGPTMIKLLEFEVDNNSCSFSGPVSIDIPLLPCVPSSCSISALVWDIRTRIFHKLPSFSSALPQLILSKTHVIAIYQPWYFNKGPQPATTILQAFVAPDPLPHSDSEGIRELRLTHEAPMEHTSHPMCLLRNSVFDPVTKATNLRILHFSESIDNTTTKYTCIDLTLSELSPDRVLPMFVHYQHLFTGETDMGLYSLTASSDDGHLRGISRSPSMPAKRDALPWLADLAQ